MKHNEKLHYGGLFDNEEQAAMQVNLLCEKNGIDRKNPMIDLEPDAMQQVTHSSHTITLCVQFINFALNIN